MIAYHSPGVQERSGNFSVTLLTARSSLSCDSFLPAGLASPLSSSPLSGKADGGGAESIGKLLRLRLAMTECFIGHRKTMSCVDPILDMRRGGVLKGGDVVSVWGQS